MSASESREVLAVAQHARARQRRRWQPVEREWHVVDDTEPRHTDSEGVCLGCRLLDCDTCSPGLGGLVRRLEFGVDAVYDWSALGLVEAGSPVPVEAWERWYWDNARAWCEAEFEGDEVVPAYRFWGLRDVERDPLTEAEAEADRKHDFQCCVCCRWFGDSAETSRGSEVCKRCLVDDGR